MKTSIYNKEEHLEGFVGNTDEAKVKSDVQKAFESGNDGNEVTSFGKEPTENNDSKNANTSTKIVARDGFDNTGTQGADSLSDDAYNSKDKNPTIESAASGTGSSSKDFNTTQRNNIKQRNEDDALNTGI
ncbi:MULTISPECIES: hypothetical protein [unclassified Pedobacter]|uniref:hypothetical protein n=1 Tax=unclassified Pedobacter TaxID=2628915 RepID=UPI001E55475E|nr:MULTISPECIES: hypothetical protein [unclassified Pedobacter]